MSKEEYRSRVYTDRPPYIDTIPNLPYASEELGKTTFLTREEAEKALGAKKDG